MKVIHCADLHLDSRLTSVLPKELANKRKRELVVTFLNMVDYAVNNDVSSIIIAGDMFDTDRILVSTRNSVIGAILANPSIDFYYLRGNHDMDNVLSEEASIPDNLHFFDDSWTGYILNGKTKGNIRLYGAELTKANSKDLCLKLQPDSAQFNIVTLHGQISASAAKDKAENINVKDLKGKGIDYLALGHIHAYKEEMIDARCTLCYPGCLEGRGFDECGEKGFVVLDIDEESRTYTHEFVPFASRMLFEEEIDVTGVSGTYEILENIRAFMDNTTIESKHLVRLALTGQVDVDCDINLDQREESFEDRFFIFKVKDDTKIRIDTNLFAKDNSLKGEFIRTVEEDDSLSDEDKRQIIRIGLQGFNGEDFE